MPIPTPEDKVVDLVHQHQTTLHGRNSHGQYLLELSSIMLQQHKRVYNLLAHPFTFSTGLPTQLDCQKLSPGESRLSSL